MTVPRRAFLGGVTTVGATSIAGCVGLLDDEAGTDQPRFDPEEYLALIDDPVVRVTRPFAVDPAESTVRDGIGRTEMLLTVVEDDLDADAVPNERVRDRLQREADRAAERMAELDPTDSQFGTIQSLDRAQSGARFAAAGTQASTGAISTTELDSEASQIANQLGDIKATWEYVADTFPTAVLVHGRLERNHHAATASLERDPEEPRESTLGVAERAEHVESARVRTAAIEELLDRYHDGIESTRDPVALETALDRARTTIEDHDLPSIDDDPETLIPEDVQGTTAERLLQRTMVFEEPVLDRLEDDVAVGSIASAILSAFDYEVRIRVADALKAAVEDERYHSIEGISDVERVREDATRWATDPPVDPSQPTMFGDYTTRTINALARVDRDLAMEADRSRTLRLDTELIRYLDIGYRFVEFEGAVETAEAWFG